MKTALQIVSWFGIVIGALAIIGSVSSGDSSAFIGGAMFAGQGILALVYIDQTK